MKLKTKPKSYWATVKVVRGYVNEVRLFDSLDAATRRENWWRPRVNPDYDEVAVIKARVTDGAYSHRRARPA